MNRNSTEKQKLLSGYIALIYAMFLLFYLVSSYRGMAREQWCFFYAFTNQSNIMVLLWLISYGLCVFCNLPIRRFFQSKILMTAITVYISITFFIVAFVLNPIYMGAWQPLSSSGEFITHNLTPVVMWIYFFIVPGEGTLKIKHAALVLIYPALYLTANLLLGANVSYLNGRPAYAYHFINPGSYPDMPVFIGAISGLFVIFILFGILLITMKNRIENSGHE